MRESLRILLVHDYAPLYGGAEVVNAALVDGLRGRGHQVRRFTSTAGFDALPNDSPQRPEYACRGTMSRWRTALQSANPWAPAALRQAIVDFRPDVVHCGMFTTQLSPLILPVLREVPAVFHAAWYRVVCPTGLKLLPNGESCSSRAGTVCFSSGCLPARDWVPLMAQMQMLRRWRGVFRETIANSRATANVLAADGIGNVIVVPNGVASAPAPAKLADTPGAVFAGRLVKEKGVDLLLKAFAAVHARLPQATLDIVGDGPERTSLEAASRSLDLEHVVRFHGHQSRAQAEAIAVSAWVQVVPSRWAEPFGLVAAEAMMRGTAVVASASGGLADIVRHETTGLLVPPANVSALGESMHRILSDRPLAEQWGQAGNTVALADYGHERFLDRMLAVYASVRASSLAVSR